MEKQIQIKVQAQAWADLLSAKAKEAAFKREVESLEKQLGIASGSALAEAFGLKDGERAEAVVVDGNGSPIGKLTVSYRPGYVAEVKPTWIKRPS